MQGKLSISARLLLALAVVWSLLFAGVAQATPVFPGKTSITPRAERVRGPEPAKSQKAMSLGERRLQVAGETGNRAQRITKDEYRKERPHQRISAASVVPYQIAVASSSLANGAGNEIASMHYTAAGGYQVTGGYIPKLGDVFTYSAEVYYNWEGSEAADLEDKGPQEIIVRPEVLCFGTTEGKWFGDPIKVTAPSWVHS